MSGIRPLFTSAPRLKLRIGPNVIAYAIGFNVNMTVSVEPVYSIGEYGPVALEPTMYNTVTGTLQILRLRSPAALSNDATYAGTTSTNFNTFTSTSGLSNTVGTAGVGSLAATQPAPNSPMSQSNLFQMLDPVQVLTTSTIDIDVYIRVPIKDASTISATIASSITSFASSGEVNGLTTEFLLMSIKDARIISRNSNISMGSLVNEPLNFQGLLLTGSTNLNSNDKGSFSLDSSVGQG